MAVMETDLKLKFWIKERQFRIFDYPALSLTDVAKEKVSFPFYTL